MAFVNGMFPAAKLGRGDFSGAAVTNRVARNKATTVMRVDAFQRKFQTFGKIGIDYKVPKKNFQFKRGGVQVKPLEYPTNTALAGVYPISLCGKMTGASKVLAKAQEMIAMDRLRRAKTEATSSGIYNIRCNEGASKGEAEYKRVFNREAAFREAQKPVQERLRKQYDDRRKAFILSDMMGSEEKKFSTMPLLTKVYIAAHNEGKAACSRYATPYSLEEKFIMKQYENEARAENCKYGEYGPGSTEGFVKGQAEARRVAVGSSMFRAAQKNLSESTDFSYTAPREAVKLNAADESAQLYYYKWPSVASARIQD